MLIRSAFHKMDAKDAVSFRSRVGYICNKVDSIVYVHSFRFV